jgi:2-keto-4-pentenoate hydratase/2-oxohepta-3-ene-1,7-dioic acid hydratase in catechol pathway
MDTLVRYQHQGATSYGLLDNQEIRQIAGGLFGDHFATGARVPLASVKLLYPCEPTKILAVGLNYKSHLDGRPAPANPEIFYKPVSALQNPGDPIRTPLESVNMHFEGELVVVMGPGNSVFGVTCGNDVSERDWQRGPNKDLQWWRAKGADTFAPLGPVIVSGLDYSDLRLQTKVNGKTLQDQTTRDLLFPVSEIIAYISKWVTLNPGDVVYTGTPGNTTKLNPGDVVEVSIENIGILSNPVA